MTAVLTRCDITDLQSAVNALMLDTAAISRPTPSRDASGGMTDTFNPAGTVPIQLYRPSNREQQALAGQVRDAQVQMMGKVPAGADVRYRDLLTVNNVRFEVVLVVPDPTLVTARRLALVVTG